MTIHWIKCSERMPPDDESRYIFCNLNYKHIGYLIYTGYAVNMLGVMDGDVWTPYTEEAWGKLNDNRYKQRKVGNSIE